MQAASGMENPRSSPAMRYFTAILITLLLAVPAMFVELFRYRGATKDGGTLQYVFETDEQDVPKTMSQSVIRIPAFRQDSRFRSGQLSNQVNCLWIGYRPTSAECGDST